MSTEILLIEDDAAFREIVRTVLVDSGYDVSSCESDVEALRQAKKKRPDLILSDYNLGKSNDGVQLSLAILESLEADIPVVIMSGLQEGESAANAQSFDFLRKPFDFHKLEDTVRGGLQAARTFQKTSRVDGKLVSRSYQGSASRADALFRRRLNVLVNQGD